MIDCLPDPLVREQPVYRVEPETVVAELPLREEAVDRLVALPADLLDRVGVLPPRPEVVSLHREIALALAERTLHVSSVVVSRTWSKSMSRPMCMPARKLRAEGVCPLRIWKSAAGQGVLTASSANAFCSGMSLRRS